eukprot:7381544-Prymnesium_polylepis.1
MSRRCVCYQAPAPLAQPPAVRVHPHCLPAAKKASGGSEQPFTSFLNAIDVLPPLSVRKRGILQTTFHSHREIIEKHVSERSAMRSDRAQPPVSQYHAAFARAWRALWHRDS